MVKNLILAVMLFSFACTKKENTTQSLQQPEIKLGELPIKIEEPFPKINLKDAAGISIPITDFEGKVIILDFWASWCIPCIKELPDIEKLYSQKKSSGLVVLAINTDENPSEVIPNFKSKFNLTFPIFQDSENVLITLLQIQGLPFNVILDKKLRVRKIQPGIEEWFGDETISLIDRLLAE